MKIEFVEQTAHIGIKAFPWTQVTVDGKEAARIDELISGDFSASWSSDADHKHAFRHYVLSVEGVRYGWRQNRFHMAIFPISKMDAVRVAIAEAVKSDI